MSPDEYFRTRPQLAVASQRRMLYSLNRWSRFGGPDIDRVRPADLDGFRATALVAGLSPHSIEQTCADIALLAGCSIGTRLRLPPPRPDVPTAERIGKLYAAADVAKWPHRSASWLRCDPSTWWKCWIVVAGYWGLRFRDLARLLVSDAAGGRITAGKTGKHHPLHLAGFVARHVATMGRDATETLFGRMPPKQLRRELHRIAQAAGVPYVVPHGFRRFAVQIWSDASSSAGQIVHGCGLPRVMRHYLDPAAILERAAPAVQIPAEWLTEEERDAIATAETDLLRHYRGAAPGDREALLRIARRL